MSTVIRPNKITGEMVVEYAKVANQLFFRYCFLNQLIKSKNMDTAILVNTNQRIAKRPIEQIETGLRNLNLEFRTVLVESNPNTFFGIALPSKKKQPMNEYKIMIELADNSFSKELFEVIKTYDIAIGFGKNKTVEEIYADYRHDDKMVLFNTDYFEDCVYDSAVCECLRSTFDVEELVRKSENEIAI